MCCIGLFVGLSLPLSRVAEKNLGKDFFDIVGRQ